MKLNRMLKRLLFHHLTLKKEGGDKPISSYRLYTAGSPEAGRGTTPTIAHLSEVAFWQHDEKILAGLFQGISEAPGTEVILESTANGAQGEFYRLWKGALEGENEYLPIFLPWFSTDEYYRKPPRRFRTFLRRGATGRAAQLKQRTTLLASVEDC